jgi:hypothetical protein
VRQLAAEFGQVNGAGDGERGVGDLVALFKAAASVGGPGGRGTYRMLLPRATQLPPKAHPVVGSGEFVVFLE